MMQVYVVITHPDIVYLVAMDLWIRRNLGYHTTAIGESRLWA